MKHFLRFSLLLIFIYISNVSSIALGRILQPGFYNYEIETSINAIGSNGIITATINGSASVCQNEPEPLITFTGKGGSAPYTFVYQVNGGSNITISTTISKDNITVKVPTGSSSTLNYSLKSVKDATSVLQVSYGTATVTVNALPSFDFSFIDNQCSGNGVQFKTSPSELYSYFWTFGDDSTSTESNPRHLYEVNENGTQNYTVSLSMTNITTSCKNTITKVIPVTQAPDAALNGTGSGSIIKGIPLFKVCNNFASTFTFTNISKTKDFNEKYKINWGDGTPDFESKSWILTTHTYPIGLWNLNYTVADSSGCSITKPFIVFVGSNPGVGLGNPGNTDVCISQSLTFPITGTSNNPPGTTYTVSFNDGSSDQVFPHPPPASVTHTFLKTSCGTTSSLGSDNYPNSFYAKMVAKNPCSQTVSLVIPILISTPPVADFILPLKSICTETQTCFTNTSMGGYESNVAACNISLNLIWNITPITGVTLISGVYGNDFGLADQSLWSSGSQTICLKFSIPGTYTITMSSANRCATSTRVQTICVEPPTIPKFTLDKTQGCIPLTVSATNNTNTANTCPTISYLWETSYLSSYCGNQSGVTFDSITTNPVFVFKNPGTYTVKLTAITSCLPQSTTQTVIVTKPPTVSINKIADFCGPTSINPSAVIKSCSNASSSLTYAWSFPGGSPVSSTSLNPTNIAYNNEGNYTISLTVTNECGNSSTATKSFVINKIPEITNTSLSQSICSGLKPELVLLTSNPPNATYSWTATATPGITGFTSSGNSNSLPIVPIFNSGDSPGTVTYSITPSLGSCTGEAVTYTITVNPSAAVNFSTVNQTICSEESSVEVKLSSTTTGATLSWSTEQPIGISEAITLSGTNIIPAQTFTNTTDAPISVIYNAKATVSGATSCAGAVYSDTITINPKPFVLGSLKETICSGSNFSFSPSTGAGNQIPTGTQYTWDAPLITPAGSLTGGSLQSAPQTIISQTLVNNSSAIATATYLVTPTTNVCKGSPFVLIVSVNPKAIVDTIPNSSFCNNDPFSELRFTGNVPGTVYQWLSDNPSIGIAGSGSDKITAFKTSNTGNTPIKATITVTPTYNSAKPECDGAPIQFSITVNPSGQVNNPGTINVCNGAIQTVNFSTNNTGGTTTYSWTNSNTDLGLDASGKGNISFTTINNGDTPLTATITVIPTFTGNGLSCTGTAEQFNITVNPTPTVNLPKNQTVCNGSQTNEIQFTGNVPTAQYNWRIDNSSIGFSTGGTGDINPFTAVNDGSSPAMATITVIPTINGCNGLPVSFTITVNPSPFITKQPDSTTICLGEKPTILSISYINGVGTPTYQWVTNISNSTIGSSLIANATNASYDPPGSIANTRYYYCVITFPTGGCNTLTSEIARVTINQPPVITTVNRVISSGEVFTVVPISQNGNIVPMGTTYTWSEPVISPPGSIVGTSAQTTPQDSISQTLTNNTTGIATVTYTITPTSGTCIGAGFQVIVTVNPSINPNATINPVTCFGSNDGSITTNMQGGVAPYHVLWTGPNGFNSTMASISGLKPGHYDLDITDALGTKFSLNYTITEPIEISVVTKLKKDITCFGAANGEIAISTMGGTGELIVRWTKDMAFYATTNEMTNLSPGTYVVTVTDVNNCAPKILTYTITEPTALVITLKDKANVKCFGDSTGSLSVNVQGGSLIEITPGIFDYKYAWSGPNGFTSSNKNLIHISAGNYQLAVTDNSGCTQTLAVKITEPPQLVVSASTSPIGCFGANNASIKLTISGGVPPYLSQWDNFASGEFQDNLSAGDYTITVMDDNGCQTSIKINIPEVPIFRVSPVVKHVTCSGANDGSIALNFEGGKKPISLVWTDNSTSGTTRNNIGPGTYTVNIRDGAACSISKTFEIVEPAPLTLVAAITNAADCNLADGGAIDLLATGGTSPYLYSWSNGAKTQDLSHITDGNYMVTVTDSVGCKQTAQYVVKRPLPIDINVTSKIEYDCTGKEIKAINTANTTGGVPPYQFEWSEGTVNQANQEIMETNQSGTVKLTVTDVLGCSVNTIFNIHIPVSGFNYQLLDCDLRSYQLTPIKVNELETTAYSWDFGDGTSSKFQNPKHTYQGAGSYKIRLSVSTANSCDRIYEQTVNVEPPPEVILDQLVKFCKGDSILIYATGAKSYRWNNGTTGDSLLIKEIGEYSVIGFSESGCTATVNFTAANYDLVNYTIQSDNTVVTTDRNELHLWSESIPYSNYSWDFGDGNHGQGDNLFHTFIAKDGYYDVNLKVINPNGCIEEATKRIQVNITSFPNTFTPNGDGINDIYLKGWHIQVYNRNGFLMYEGKEGWNGNYNGKPVANDTYFVVIYDSTESGTKYKTGYVTVIGTKKGL